MNRVTKLVPWPRASLLVIILCAAVVTAMGIDFHDKSHGTAFDTSVDNWIRARPSGLSDALVHLTDPSLVFSLFALIIVIAWVKRRRDVAVLALLTPLATIGLVEEILKPLVNRTIPTNFFTKYFGFETVAFPSGHESGLGSLVAVLGLIVIRSGWTTRRRALALTALIIVNLLAAFGLVGRYYHYATDVIGAFLVCVAVTLIVAMVLDLVLPRLMKPHGVAAQAPQTSELS